MNRIIKFRVWDGFKIYYPSYNLQPTNCDPGGNAGLAQGLKDCSWIGDAEIQQFTGLLDKNGREIYESDIVSVLDENNVFEVKFGKVRRNIIGFDTKTIYPIELSTFYFEQEGRPYFSITNNHLGKHDLEDTLVIGNIFENKELLE